jgi:hypothetical protein
MLVGDYDSYVSISICSLSIIGYGCLIMFQFFVLLIQHGAAHVYPKLASLPVTHPLRKEAADVKVDLLTNI